MDSQVKERLVGAAVLVALGVWLIPWVLDGPSDVPEPEDTTSPLTLPSSADTTPVRIETIELDPAVPTREPPADAEGTVSEPTTVAVVTPDAGARDATPPVIAAEREPQEPAGLAEPEVSTAAPGGWSVQVGSFGEVANANQLVTRLSTFGYSASVSEFRSGGAMMYRVRVRGLESEGDAEVAASALSARGIPVQVIPPE